MDEAKKFLFETYSIDGNDKQTKQAIQKNGDVVVKFYNEDILQLGPCIKVVIH